MPRKGRQELPRISDRISFIYVDHAVIEQDAFSIVLNRRDGRVPLPISQFTCLLIGPGTTITHAALKALADNECMAFWCGEQGSVIYSAGRPKAAQSQSLLRQAALCMDEKSHMAVVRNMYAFRFGDKDLTSSSLAQLRGIEGIRMKKLYQDMSEKFGVEWNGRSYKPGSLHTSDTVNQLLTIGNSYLYAICEACICALGYSPALGFIHTGRMLSFVYDIADLYKGTITIPAAFEGAASNAEDRSSFRSLLRRHIMDTKLLETIADDIAGVLSVDFDLSSIPKATGLWANGGYVVDSSRNYGGVP